MKIAILGFGVEGKSVYEYLKSQDAKYEIDIFDEAVDAEIVKKVSDVYDVDFADYDMIVRSPSINPIKLRERILSDKNGDTDFNLTSATQLFFGNCPAKIIGVTGTKGKGTTATMIRDILQADNKTAHLLGNIGVSALDMLPEIRSGDIVVFELSSFQLWNLSRSPQVAVVLRIEAEHLDIHIDFDDYISAKTNITRHQTAQDKVVYYEKNQFSRQIAEASAGKKVAYPGQIDFDETVLQVPGVHYIENAKAAIAATKDIIDDAASVEKGLKNFRAMPHRLELVREIADVKYYDDNFSTGLPSLDVAVRAFPNNPIVLIAGGKDRGNNNFDDIARAINDSTVREVVLIGETAAKLGEKLTIKHRTCFGLADAVRTARDLARPNDVVLMSPGAASFDMFKNFHERGAEFQTEVAKL